MTPQLIDLKLIDPNPWQPRQHDDPEHIQKLALSIAQDGLLQPPAARQVGERYQLVFGHSRHQAYCFLQVTLETDPEWFKSYNVNMDGKVFFAMPVEIIDLTDEGMYRQAVSENLQRKDLTAIEEAKAMKRAQQDFEYTSLQVGELFSKDPATVRGLIRLLDLPQEIQDRIERGEISQGAARKFLSLQRAIGADALSKELSASNMKAYGRTHLDPDELASVMIQNNNKLVQMSHRWDSSEPRGGSGLWLLSWTVPAPFTLPAVKDALKHWDGPGELMGARGLLPIEDVFKVILDLLTGKDSVTGPLTWEQVHKYAPEYEKAIDYLHQLTSPPACTACPFHIQVEGSHYCGFRACHDNKKRRWGQIELEKISKKLGMPVYSAAQDGKAILKLVHYDRRHKEWVEGKDKDLRLLLKPSQYTHDFTGSHVVEMVMTGEKVKKAQEAAESQNARTDYSALYERNRKRENLIGHAISSFVWEVVAPVFAEPLEKLGKGPTIELDEYVSRKFYSSSKMPFDKKSAPARRMAFILLWETHRPYQGLSYDDPTPVQPVVKAAKKLQGVATTWGVSLPANFLETASKYEPDLSEFIDKKKEKKVSKTAVGNKDTKPADEPESELEAVPA